MRIPPYGEISPAAKEYFRQIGEWIDGALFPLALYEEVATEAEKVGKTQTTSKKRRRHEVKILDSNLIAKTLPYTISALHYLGYRPLRASIALGVMLDGGTRPLRFSFYEENKSYAVYLKLAEPISLILRELYKRIGSLRSPYHSVTDGKVALEQEIQGLHAFEMPEDNVLVDMQGYKEAIIGLDVSRFLGGFGDLAKPENSVILCDQHVVKAVVPIDFNVAETYNENIQAINKTARCSALRISAQEYEAIYKNHEQKIWYRITREEHWFTRLLSIMKTMPELEDMERYLRNNYQQLQKKYEMG